MTILVGSAIRLLCGEAGVFVVSNEAFDPQSSAEYILYQLDALVLPALLASVQVGIQPNSARPHVVSPLPAALVSQIGIEDKETGEEEARDFERCSLFLQDHIGILGVIHYLRPAGAYSCFDRLAAIFQHSAEGILTVDRALRIIDFNPAMERLTGWRESEVLGRFYFEVLRPKDRQGNDLGLQDSPILQAFAGQTVVNREMIISARDGQRFDASVTASCVRSTRGEPMNGILNIRDITREREQEEQRSTFISVISHELQTPIAIIKGYASTLARTDAMLDSEALHSRLLAVEEEADRLNKLVGNLLYASRIQAGGLQMEITPLELPPLIEGVVRRLQAKSPDISVTLDIPPNLPTVMADRDRIEEVLQTPQRRVVTVASRATGDEVIVSVSDTGIGISLRDQEEIFTRFRRIGNQLTRTTPGTGLGLYICHAIVEAHGGHIWVESALHEGSTFSFSLPRVEKARLPMVVF